MLEDRADDDRMGLVSGEGAWTWRQIVRESRARAAVAQRLGGQRRTEPPHIGVLLDNVPEYLFWMGAAALVGAVIVGVNPTRRGSELAGDIRFTGCDLLVTDAAGAELLSGLDTGVERSRLVRVDLSGGSPAPGPDPGVDSVGAIDAKVSPDDLYLLLFTSGTTGSPKAVRCTQGRLAAIGERASAIYGFDREEICYCPMPLFHGNAVMALWAPALYVGACIAVNGKFSASRFIEDVRRFGATRFTYVGKALSYVLATPERPDDADNSLRVGFGTEASARDRARFEQRFGCRLVEGYGSSEGGLSITRTAETPPDALGPAPEGVAVLDPTSGRERPRARLGPSGRLLNPEAIGELASRSGVHAFEGYFNNPDANRARASDGWYRTGDLGYIDEKGFVYFAGRNDDWLRVDSENFSVAPIERILERHPDVVAAAVYAVPDPKSADQVMAAVELRPGADAGDFCRGLDAFLARQRDLGTKWAPRFVTVVDALPLTATGKITKTELRKQRWSSGSSVYWRRGRASDGYTVLSEDDVKAIEAEFARHGRSQLLDS